MPGQKHRKFSFQKLQLLLIVILCAVIGITAWSAFRRLGEQVTVNRIATQEVTGGEAQIMTAGCEYVQVQCVKEPCDPVLVCNSPQPLSSCIPNPCPPEATCKLLALQPGQEYCKTPTPLITPTPVVSARIGPIGYYGLQRTICRGRCRFSFPRAARVQCQARCK